ncbi:S24 family peptidase [Desulfocurvibacter africanus]|uniref:Peptidase S24/S26A/S26B, conserved region n=1 Tax=Desulfocurvibacter africanus subsp. africanus str. Walvis Bay TaxID=690850 RepID=F3YZA4_DESAF|nr:S24 family peptidase [Desulfocurvibacter africanus]EGJ50860.1 Peptidase S24/S26A/S26B, conserved region [Desulfocurvibacter africanus subsp. africanus str. Walvis Bay]
MPDISRKLETRQLLIPFSKRLQQVIDNLGVEKKAFALAGDIKQPTLTAYLNAQSQPSQDVVAKWILVYGINANWLLTGEGPMFREERAEAASKPAYQIAPFGPDGQTRRTQVVRGPDDQELGAIIEVHAEAGPGQVKTRWEPDPIGTVCIPPEYAKPGLFGLHIKGSAMEPLINRGALVGVNAEDRKFVSGDIYAVFIPYEGLTTRRLFLDPDTSVYVLRSIHPDHPDMELPVDKSENLIVGRVVWVMQGV